MVVCRISKSGELQILMLRFLFVSLFCFVYDVCLFVCFVWYMLLQSINLVLYEFFQISTRITEEWNLKKMHIGRQIR